MEYAITGDTDYNARSLQFSRSKRQISGDQYPVYIDEFNDNLVGDIVLNLEKIIGTSTIGDFYYYDVRQFS